MQIQSELATALAPTGRLRASINLGNPILARRDEHGDPMGVSVDLARALAEQLGVALELKAFDTAARSVQAITEEEADVGFFAVDPVRGAGIEFTAPYVLIEGAYLVRAESVLQDTADVDAIGHRVIVGKGSAYDLFLTRELKQATIGRAETSPAVVDTFLALNADVAAGVRQQLEADAVRIPSLRLLPGRFMVIRQAMGLSKTRSRLAAEFLTSFVEEAKASGFVGRELARHNIQGASFAPATS